MTIRVLSSADVRAAINVEEAIESMADAFTQLAAGTATVPQRQQLVSAAGTTLVMPAWLHRGEQLGTKLVSIFPGNHAAGLPAIHGIVIMLDGETGRPWGVLDGTELTALRTAAGSALAARHLAPTGASTLALFGAGPQARAHVEAFLAVRPIAEIRIVSRGGESARRLADEINRRFGARLTARDVRDPAEAVHGADLIVAATTSETPVFDGRELEAGVHVTGVGSFRPTMQEIDANVVCRARVVVDTREGALAEAGDLIRPLAAGLIGEDHIAAQLGDIVSGACPGGADGHELTFYKSVGNAAQDVAIAGSILDAADRQGLGTVCAF